MTPIELTPAEMAQLTEELAELEGPRREDAVAAIATARGFGDLSENFEYHAAKNEQGLLERQITLLEQKLSAAVVIEKAASANVGTGSVVEFEDEEGDHVTIGLGESEARRTSCCKVASYDVQGLSLIHI